MAVVTDSISLELTDERLEAEITELAAHIASATCRWLLLVAEYDRREAWATWGCHSCAHWLSWRCGTSLRTAREHVRVRPSVGGFPPCHGGIRAGPALVLEGPALTRVATASHRADLVGAARANTRVSSTRWPGRTAAPLPSPSRMPKTSAWPAEGCSTNGKRMERSRSTPAWRQNREPCY